MDDNHKQINKLKEELQQVETMLDHAKTGLVDLLLELESAATGGGDDKAGAHRTGRFPFLSHKP